ncbi:MAG: LysR family transcriptional regulator [Gammaproteobacteria bacterium]|nr:LysR family transcriptional regulator [Gammaproteobacteria bacterium]
MDRLQNIETFVRVAQLRSFSQAAKELRVVRSVITSRIQNLESYIGAPLFYRNTRSVQLTEIGWSYLQDCEDLVSRAHIVVDKIRDSKSSPKGVLRVHALTGLVLGRFAHFIHQFQEQFPDIQLHLNVSDAAVDPVQTGYDCALQIFPIASTNVIAKKLFPIRRILCASPTYLKIHGTPKDPRELHRFQLGLYSHYPSRDKWTFHHSSELVTIYLHAQLLTNSVHLLREYALDHAGIVCLPTLVATDPLLNAQLQVVLPEHILSSFWLTVIYPPTARENYKLNLFLTYMNQYFQRHPPWDKELLEQKLIPDTLIIH